MISYADKAKQGLLRQPRATVFANSTEHSPSSSSSSSNLVDNSNSRTTNNNSRERSHKIDRKVTHECDRQEEGFEETFTASSVSSSSSSSRTQSSYSQLISPSTQSRTSQSTLREEEEEEEEDDDDLRKLRDRMSAVDLGRQYENFQYEQYANTAQNDSNNFYYFDEHQKQNREDLLKAKMLGDTHYAYGSFGYGYYTPLPDGTAIFTPAFVPPPPPPQQQQHQQSMWGFERNDGSSNFYDGEGANSLQPPFQQQQHLQLSHNNDKNNNNNNNSNNGMMESNYHQHQHQYQDQNNNYGMMMMQPQQQQQQHTTMNFDIASAADHFSTIVGHANAQAFSNLAFPPMPERDAARVAKLRAKQQEQFRTTTGENNNKVAAKAASLVTGNGSTTTTTNIINKNNIYKQPVIHFGGGDSVGGLSLGESVRGPRFRNPERIMSVASPYKVLHEKFTRPNTREIFDGIDWNVCKGFVCKSFSEDDIHKSIKYGKWSSTTLGNQKLSEAFKKQKNINDAAVAKNTTTYTNKGKQEQQKKKKKIPQRILLLFSVNASGYFSGVAEMTSDVDFEKNETFWQREGKFCGSFNVEWLVVKDVPFTVFGKHLRVVDDRKSRTGETKRVTHSRDAQFVTPTVLRHCIEVILEHETDNGLVKDFEYYDERERTRFQARQQQRVNNTTRADGGSFSNLASPVSPLKPRTPSPTTTTPNASSQAYAGSNTGSPHTPPSNASCVHLVS